MNLTAICANLKNYFLRDKYGGTFNVVSGTAPLSNLLTGQYFRIVGSVLNDGVWQNTAEDLAHLQNETFEGEIWSMAIPRDFLELCGEIDDFNAKIEEMSTSWTGFSSESWNGYSYSISSSAPDFILQKQANIKSRLNGYRRIHE